MEVKRERPCQRRHHRVTAPMRVTFPNGDQHQAANWSLGGLRIDGVGESFLEVGKTLELELELPFQGFDISFEVSAKVVRTDADTKSIGAEFIELSERANDLMSHFIDDLIRGQMASIDDTICRIDVPVTPISTKPDPNPIEETPVRRLPLKTIIMSSIYMLLGALIFGYMFILIYSKTMRIEVSSAVVSAPLATIKMPMDGVLIPIALEEGTMVGAGQLIARIRNPELEQKLHEKRIELDQAKRTLVRMEERYRIETNRMKLYQIINRTDRDIAEARVAAASKALEAADSQFSRFSILRNKGLVEQSKLDEVAKQRALVAGRLAEAEFELERASAMDAVSGRRYYNHKEFVSDLDLLALDVEEANANVIAMSMQLEKLENAKSRRMIKAPFDGRIVSVKQPGNVTVLRNEQLFTIEKFQQPTVTAFLDQDQILEIGLHDEAKVFVPALGRHIPASVTRIDRSSAFLNSKASHYVWEDNREKSAAVQLNVKLQASDHEFIRAGLPVVVVFSRRSTNDIYHRISATVSGISRAFGNESAI
ncbi:MAG: HlyD family efflux transporter periplasmic adaptor subunit [Pseudomonadota bacterium]